ncbi:MAG: type 4a pilus biogenesis protein PilO [Planctomycetota bacterium]|jgi:Tfp pilus assembly protein PilO
MFLRERPQITICILAGVIAGVFVLDRYLPLRRRTKAIKQAIAAQTLAIAKGAADSKQLPLLKEQLLKVQSGLGNYEVNIPEQRALGVFLHRIADLMNEHNLKEQVIAPGKEVEADKFNCIPVTMQCKGKLAQISKFYSRLQALDRLVRIEQVKLTNDTSYNGQVSMETEVVVYYRATAGHG